MAYIDKHGVEFTDDKKTLVRCPERLIGKYTIPDGVIEIRAKGFAHCENLYSVMIPDSVVKIGYSAFEGCHYLSFVNIPDGVTHIGEKAFAGCEGLVSLTIPNSIIHIGQDAFLGIYNIISNNPSITNYGAKHVNALIDGLLVYSDTSKTKLLNCFDKVVSGTTIPNCGNDICGQFNITSITLPQGIIEIGEGAFDGCALLTSVIIPDSVEIIGNNAFRGCTRLCVITLPNSIRDFISVH